MAEILFIRHAATSWNQAKRLQGRADIPLAPEGVRSLAGKGIPAPFQHATWFCSPLRRARQTAEYLGISDCLPEPALIEMDWGEWEGARITELRQQEGAAMRANEARGLDLQPPSGESPRQVMVRLQEWLTSLDSQASARYGAVCHKGVIRCALALATGWEMRSKCPVRVDWNKALKFQLEPDGQLTLQGVNIELAS